MPGMGRTKVQYFFQNTGKFLLHIHPGRSKSKCAFVKCFFQQYSWGIVHIELMHVQQIRFHLATNFVFLSQQVILRRTTD